MSTENLDLGKYDGYPGSEDFSADAMNAIDNASDQDRKTWITRDGKRVAAIVPVEDALLAERVNYPAMLLSQDEMHPFRLAEKIVVERTPGGIPRLWIDGKLFEYAIVTGYSCEVRRAQTPGVTITIAAASVEIRDKA